MATHRFDAVEWQAKKQAKTDLDQPHTPPNSVPALRDRVDKIELILNIKLNE